MDFEACPCSGKTLAKLIQPAVMTVLAAGPLHGYRIAERVGAMAMFRGRGPDPTGIYRLLRRMEKEGLVASTWDTSDAGPAKRLYRLSASGRACLGRWVRTLKTYARAVEELLGAAGRAAVAR
jgi:DNA-binding PadR family transcriptional regulator